MTIENSAMTMWTLQEVWSEVVEEVNAVKNKLVDVRGEFKASKDFFSHQIHALNEEQKGANHWYDNLKSEVAGLDSTIYAMEKKLNWFCDQVSILEGEKLKAVTAWFEAMEERMSCQEDVISDLKDEVAVLHGKHCHCGEPEQIASSEAGELEYVNHKVDPLPFIILTEADGEFYKIMVPTPTLHLPWPTPICWSQLMTL